MFQLDILQDGELRIVWGLNDIEDTFEDNMNICICLFRK